MSESSPYLSIKSWNEDDRPREKLQLKGRASLSHAELIAILIGSGSRSESAVDLAKRILNSVDNNLTALGKLSIQELTRFKGIGEAKAISIITALELGNRRRQSDALERKQIANSRNVFEIFHPLLADLAHEEFWTLFLNNSNKVLGYEIISKGGFTSTSVDPRVIFTRALHYKATAIILVHNHPSGKNQPSSSDISMTKNIRQAGNILHIQVLDHVIVAHNQFYSFADEGNL